MKTQELLTRLSLVLVLSVMPMSVGLGQAPRHGIQEFNESDTFEVPLVCRTSLWNSGPQEVEEEAGRRRAPALRQTAVAEAAEAGRYIRASLAVIESERMSSPSAPEDVAAPANQRTPPRTARMAQTLRFAVGKRSCS